MSTSRRKLVVFLPVGDPATGESGREERVPELRLETVYPAVRHADVIAALRRAHPYEEQAFDVYPLVDP